MEETSKVRLVRCPKCENLLPELADYSVYQCGGCGAVLRAKNISEEREVDASSDSGLILKSDNEERVNEVTTPKFKDTSSDKGVVEVTDANFEDVDVKSSTSSIRREDDRVDSRSKGDMGKWVVQNGVDVSRNGNGSGSDGVMEREFGSRWRSGESGGVWQRGERAELEGFQRIPRNESDGVRFSTSNYVDEGPSNYRDFPNGTSRVQHLESDRAELLRKLDELKERLSRSGNIGDANKPRESFPQNGSKTSPPNFYGGSDTWFPGGSAVPNRTSMQLFGHEKNPVGARFYNHQLEPFPYNAGREMGMHGFHPSVEEPIHVHGYRDQLLSQMPSRPPQHMRSQYKEPPMHYFSRHYLDANHDLFDPYPPDANFHQPSCSCFHCYENHRATLGPHVHHPRANVPPPTYRGPQYQTRWPSDLTPEMGGFARGHPRRVVVASSGRSCHPIAGAAPLLTCSNCFELLQLPKNTLLKSKKYQKLKCGGCSTVITCTVVNKKLVFSANKDATYNHTEVDDSSTEMINTSYSHGHIHHDFSSDDYDNSGYDFQAVDADPIASTAKHQEMQSLHSSSPSTSEGEDSPIILTAAREVTDAVQRPTKPTVSPLPPGSPLQHRFGKGNRSSRSDQEKVVTTNNKAATRQNSMKEASLATEMEVPYHEYSNTGVSQDSGYTSKEENQPKGKESFFGNFIKKSFKDLSKSQTDERGKGNVFINGHHIPDRLIKKAEKRTGQILPGQYWYDFRAGFWGVMGGPCLGIIPPCIEEFNYPMPENCAGGSTAVFLNGRELHHKDLDLLASRGLPTDRERSYIVEISGRVLDEDTGEELDSLGKLAPTVEKMKRGFGMRVPKAASS